MASNTLSNLVHKLGRMANPPYSVYTGNMVKILELAIRKASNLPEAAQERLGRELLERIEALEHLRTEIEAGLRELDGGLGEEIDIEEIIRQAHEEHAKKA
jgi:hypothetical protein